MAQKPLNLDQSRIEAAIDEFATACGGTVSGPRIKGLAEEYELCVANAKPALLHVFKRKDGSTTLLAKVGQNPDLSTKLADHVAGACSRVPVVDKPLTLAKIDEGTWQFLREYLTEEGCKVTDEPLDHGVRLKVVGPQRDQVFLHRYNTGKFMMQGRPMAVYAMVASALCELHEDKRAVLEAQLETVPVQTTIDGLYEELKANLPTAVDLLGETGCAIIAPALAMCKVAVELPDYSVVAFPALRGLEYYMKEHLARHGQPVSSKTGLGAFFNQQGSLMAGCAQKIGCPKTVQALERSYALHAKHRNGLFHADGAAPAMTRTIEDKQEAVSLVYEVFRTIETTYAVIPPKG